MLSWIAYAMICAAAVAALAAGIDYAFGARVRARRSVWFAAIVASIALPVTGSVFTASREPSLITAVTSTIGVADQPRPLPPTSDTRAVLALWAAASLLMLAWLAVGQLRLHHGLRDCAETSIGGCWVLVSPDFGPAVVGVFNPRIVLPAWTLTLTEAERALVLAHEEEHRSSRDSVLLLGGVMALVLFPWNAAIWWQVARLRLAIEFDCDARVVRHGHDPFAYGELLVIARTRAARPVASALALVQMRSDLGRRIDALVARRRHSAVRASLAVGLGGALIASLAFAPAPPLPAIALTSEAVAGPSLRSGRQNGRDNATTPTTSLGTVTRAPAASLDARNVSVSVVGRQEKRGVASRRPTLTIARAPTIRPSTSSTPSYPPLVIRTTPIPMDLRLGGAVIRRAGGGFLQAIPNSGEGNLSLAGGAARGGRVTAGGLGGARTTPRDTAAAKP